MSPKDKSVRKSVSGKFQVGRPTSSEYISSKELHIKRAPWSNDEEFLLADIISKDMNKEEVPEWYNLHQRCMSKFINAREMMDKQTLAKYKMMKTDYDMFIKNLKLID